MERFTPVRIPKIAQSFAPGLTWYIPNTSNSIYLTFDDGPTPKITPWVLELLKHYDAKATFFCIGQNVEKHPEIFSQILEDGHSIGNHTYNHIKGWKVSSKDYLENTIKASKVISSKLFRPPYGKISPVQIQHLKKSGFDIVMWTILSMDWSSKVTKDQCLKNVIEKTQSGDIIVFHDSIKASQNLNYVLPKFLDAFSKKGFSFKCIPEQSQ